MEQHPGARLADRLGVPELAAVELTDEQVDHLLVLVKDARDARAIELSTAIDGGLRMVPRPLRGIVKRMVFGR